MNLTLHPQDNVERVIGCAAMVLCVVVPIITVRAVLNGIRNGFGVYAIASNRTNPFIIATIGAGEWVNTGVTEKRFVERFSATIRTFRQPTVWYLAIEYAGAFALSAVQSVEPTHMIGCGYIKLFSAFIFFTMMVLEGTLWPHCRARDSAAGVVINGIQTSAMLMMAVAYFQGDESSWLFGTAAKLLLCTMAVITVKILADIVTEIYVLVAGKRDTLEANIIQQRKDAKCTMLEEDFESLPISTSFGHSASFYNSALHGTLREGSILSEVGGGGGSLLGGTFGLGGREGSSYDLLSPTRSHTHGWSSTRRGQQLGSAQLQL